MKHMDLKTPSHYTAQTSPTDDSTLHSCFNPINFLIKKFNKVVRKSIKTQIIKVPLHPPVFWYSFGRAALEVGGRRGAPQYILHVENCFNATLKQWMDTQNQLCQKPSSIHSNQQRR